MKWKLLSCCFLLLLTCSCASMLSQKTEAELSYDSQNRPVVKLYNTKSYSDLTITLKKNNAGDYDFTYKAAKVDSASVAKEAMEAQKAMTGVISGLVNTAIGVAKVAP